jgi:hypothetical protein
VSIIWVVNVNVEVSGDDYLALVGATISSKNARSLKNSAMTPWLPGHLVADNVDDRA